MTSLHASWPASAANASTARDAGRPLPLSLRGGRGGAQETTRRNGLRRCCALRTLCHVGSRGDGRGGRTVIDRSHVASRWTTRYCHVGVSRAATDGTLWRDGRQERNRTGALAPLNRVDDERGLMTPRVCHVASSCARGHCRVTTVAVAGAYGAPPGTKDGGGSSSPSPVPRIAPDPDPDPERQPFDLSVGVLLAGFAFESYNTPKEDAVVWKSESERTDIIYLSRHFVQSVFPGRLAVRLKKGSGFSALDLWGSSDAYVIFRLGDAEQKSSTKWRTLEPEWDEAFTFILKDVETEELKIEAWDDNQFFGKPRRMGNCRIPINKFSSGSLHMVEVKLDGMGGGATLELEVQFTKFEEEYVRKGYAALPDFVKNILLKEGGGQNAQEGGATGVQQKADFVRLAFKSMMASRTGSDVGWQEGGKDGSGQMEEKEGDGKEKRNSARTRDGVVGGRAGGDDGAVGNEQPCPAEAVEEKRDAEGSTGSWIERGWRAIEDFSKAQPGSQEDIVPSVQREDVANGVDMVPAMPDVLQVQGAESVERAPFGWLGNALSNLARGSEAGPGPQVSTMEGIKAQVLTAEGGPRQPDESVSQNNEKETGKNFQKWEELSDVMRENVVPIFAQMEGLFGSWISPDSVKETERETETVLEEGRGEGASPTEDEILEEDGSCSEDEKVHSLFSTAESAVEAWAMLSHALGRKSCIVSDFEKICFIENKESDTQLTVWRDENRHRIVVAFRGTEQTKVQDIMTDLSVSPISLNPERVGGDMDNELMVHGGFLNAYMSIQQPLFSVLESAISPRHSEPSILSPRWHIYATGHSLGGALATIFALNILNSNLARKADFKITMYNFGSPRVGNRIFADEYNKIVKDSWRIVNYNDIICNIPRLMGYCHVAQPVYLGAGMIEKNEENSSGLFDEMYGISTIDEALSRIQLPSLYKQESTFLNIIIASEIRLLEAVGDGTSITHHMENFYFINLLKDVQRMTTQTH